MLTSPLAEQRFAVIDVETTGLSARRHRILQVAVVEVLGDGTPVTSWSTVVRKPRLRRLGASHIHGLTARDLRGAPRFAEVAADLVNRLDGTIVVAHNVGFDWAFLRRELARAGYPVPDAARLCTLRLSRSLDPERHCSHRLPDVAERYGIPLERPHDALADAQATAAVLPLLLAATDAGALDRLRPALRGTSTTWPRYQRRSWLGRRLGRRASPQR